MLEMLGPRVFLFSVLVARAAAIVEPLTLVQAQQPMAMAVTFL
jgi:hypothetical protein